MITLFHHPKSRSSRFIFLLEELGAPYTIKRVTIRTRNGGGARDSTNPHPHGKVPAISNDGEMVVESPAIALYLTDAFPRAGLGPAIGDPKRGAYLSWLVYYGSVLEPAFISKFQNVPVLPVTSGWVTVEEAMEHVVATLSQGPHLLGEKFSAADILYGTTFAMFAQSDMMPKTPVIEDYIKRVVSRPAYARATEKDDG